MNQTKTCQNCKKDFTLEQQDFELLAILKVPAPTFCPQCRMIRRMNYRNEHSLFKRACDLCKRESIMQYPAGVKFPVYCKPCWWGDGWDPTSYARDYDFSRPFFAQFEELMNTVPRSSVVHQGMSVNSEYTNRVTDMNNCYLVFATTGAENCKYSTWVNGSKECVDCYATMKSQRCYECIDSSDCYNVAFARESIGCSDSRYLLNCRNCTNCFGCVNVRNKQYCILNQQYTREEYGKKMAEYALDSDVFHRDFKKQFDELCAKAIVPALVVKQSVNVSGNWLTDCKNTTNSFNCQNTDNVRHSFPMFNAKDIMDQTSWGAGSERIYECASVGMLCANVRWASECWAQLIDAEYCLNCHSAKDLFGCNGIRKGQYMILNKQYTEADYKALTAKIRAHMDEMKFQGTHGRVYGYGEFFPFEIAPFAYNETMSNEYFPISEAQAREMGYQWREPVEKKYTVTVPFDQIPDRAGVAPDSLTSAVIGCEHNGQCKDQCATAFRLLPEELAMYKSAKLPLPRLCFNCRHYGRLGARNPLKLWPRACQCDGAGDEKGSYKNTAKHQHGEGRCPNTFETSYAPERPESVYCIECYNAEIV